MSKVDCRKIRKPYFGCVNPQVHCLQIPLSWTICNQKVMIPEIHFTVTNTDTNTHKHTYVVIQSWTNMLYLTKSTTKLTLIKAFIIHHIPTHQPPLFTKSHTKMSRFWHVYHYYHLRNLGNSIIFCYHLAHVKMYWSLLHSLIIQIEWSFLVSYCKK